MSKKIDMAENDIVPMVDIDENSAADFFDCSKMSKEDYQAMVEFCKRNGYLVKENF